MRSVRDRPDPLSITGASAPVMRSCHQRLMTSREASSVAGPVAPGVRAGKLNVRKSCCAMTLLLYLLMSRITSANVGELSSKIGAATAPGTVVSRPSCTVPPSFPPISRHIPSTARAA